MKSIFTLKEQEEIKSLNELVYYKFDEFKIRKKLEKIKELEVDDLIYNFDECCDGDGYNYNFDNYFYKIVKYEIENRKNELREKKLERIVK